MIQMIGNLPYQLDPLVAVALILGVAIAVSLIGQWLTDRLFSREERCAHNDLLGPAAGIAGVINAVLLAFIVFAAWTYYDRARDVVSQEVALVTDIWRDAEAVSKGSDSIVHNSIVPELQSYLSTVVETEWPSMKVFVPTEAQRHPEFRVGWRALRNAYDLALQQEAGPLLRKTVAEEMVKRFNALFDARRQRIAYSTDGALNTTVWGVVLAGGFVSIACCWLFGFKSRRLHAASTALVAASFGLVFFLIIALQWPFRGGTQISADPYCAVVRRVFRQEIDEAKARQVAKAPVAWPVHCPPDSTAQRE